MVNVLSTYNKPVPIMGTVYGVALYAGVASGSGSTAFANDAPSSPVLFLKPSTTHLANGGIVGLPSSSFAVEASATLAIVLGRNTRSVSARNALDGVAGYTLAIDLTEQGAGLFRPPIREKCRDGFLPIGPAIVDKNVIRSLREIRVGLEIDGDEVAAFKVSDILLEITKTIEEISSYMTLRAGDVLLAARTVSSAPIRAGSKIAAVSADLGRLECTLGLDEGALE